MKEEKKGNNRESNIFKGKIFHFFRIMFSFAYLYVCLHASYFVSYIILKICISETLLLSLQNCLRLFTNKTKLKI